MRLDTALTHERAKQKPKSENTNSFEESDKNKRFVLIGFREAKPGELGKDVPERLPQERDKKPRKSLRERKREGGRQWEGESKEEKSGKEGRGYGGGRGGGLGKWSIKEGGGRARDLNMSMGLSPGSSSRLDGSCWSWCLGTSSLEVSSGLSRLICIVDHFFLLDTFSPWLLKLFSSRVSDFPFLCLSWGFSSSFHAIHAGVPLL